MFQVLVFLTAAWVCRIDRPEDALNLKFFDRHRRAKLTLVACDCVLIWRVIADLHENGSLSVPLLLMLIMTVLVVIESFLNVWTILPLLALFVFESVPDQAVTMTWIVCASADVIVCVLSCIYWRLLVSRLGATMVMIGSILLITHICHNVCFTEAGQTAALYVHRGSHPRISPNF